MSDASPLLQVQNLEAFYGPVMALRGVSIDVFEGKVVAILGANGAGKTTLMKTISGTLSPRKGSISLAGEFIQGSDPDKLVRKGIAHVPEGREVFPFLSVEENLSMGAYTRRDKAEIRHDMEMVYDYFPMLLERRNQPAGTLSGGQQQMLAIGRALMARPKLLLLDEPSMGLAPLIIDEIFGIIKELQQEGITIFVVEQNASEALAIADRGYVLETGDIVATGSGHALLNDESVKAAYLGG